MKKLKKIKLADLAPQDLNKKDLAKVVGGNIFSSMNQLEDGCYSGVCLTQRSTAADLCKDAWCTHGVGG